MPRQNLSKRDTKKMSDKSWDNIIGFVTKVHAHDGTETALSNHEVNVQSVSGAEEFKRVPVQPDRNGSIKVPQKGDAVELGFLKSKTQRPVVRGYAYTEKVRAPLARAGHFRREFGGDSGNNLYIEAEPKDHSAGDANVVRLAVKADGLSNPVARIEIDLSGSDPVLRLTRNEAETDSTDMGLEMDFGSGEFKLGDGGGFGIVSDGSGNFTWYENSMDFVDDGSTIEW